MKLPYSLSLTALLALAATSNAAVNVSFDTDFNSAGSLEANFTDGDASAYFSEQDSVGLNGSRAVFMPVTDSSTEEIWTSKSSFSLSSGETYTLGGYFFQDGSASDGFGALSFSANSSNDSTPGQAFTTGNSSIGIAFYGLGYTFESVDASGTVSRGTTNFRSWGASSIDDAWNYVEFSLEYLGGDDFQVSAISYDAAADGSLSTSYTSDTQAFTNSDLADATTVYAAFGSRGNRYEVFDTSPIPEPSAYALLLGFVAFGLISTLRRPHHRR